MTACATHTSHTHTHTHTHTVEAKPFLIYNLTKLARNYTDLEERSQKLGLSLFNILWATNVGNPFAQLIITFVFDDLAQAHALKITTFKPTNERIYQILRYTDIRRHLMRRARAAFPGSFGALSIALNEAWEPLSPDPRIHLHIQPTNHPSIHSVRQPISKHVSINKTIYLTPQPQPPASFLYISFFFLYFCNALRFNIVWGKHKTANEAKNW